MRRFWTLVAALALVGGASGARAGMVLVDNTTSTRNTSLNTFISSPIFGKFTLNSGASVDTATLLLAGLDMKGSVVVGIIFLGQFPLAEMIDSA